MPEKKPENPPASPTLHGCGMTLRDWFAGQALAGLCANPGGPFQANGMSGWGAVNCDQNLIAQECLKLADAMLEERLK